MAKRIQTILGTFFPSNNKKIKPFTPARSQPESWYRAKKCGFYTSKRVFQDSNNYFACAKIKVELK
jgi:hypothetical protein